MFLAKKPDWSDSGTVLLSTLLFLSAMLFCLGLVLESTKSLLKTEAVASQHSRRIESLNNAEALIHAELSAAYPADRTFTLSPPFLETPLLVKCETLPQINRTPSFSRSILCEFFSPDTPGQSDDIRLYRVP